MNVQQTAIIETTDFGSPLSAQGLALQSGKGELRFITCGSVDDGKSTLIGRMLYDSKLLYEDQLAALERDSKKSRMVSGGIDFSLLVDGLEAEREQGITIDVAYRFFSTSRRSFIVADTPGHEQYTRNMATGASNAELAVLLVDARNGLLPQTRRHSAIVSLLGIRHVVLAVNKMDAIDDTETRFAEIRDAYLEFAAKLKFDDIVCIPVSALRGDNVFEPSEHMPWYAGPTLMHYLETVDVTHHIHEAPFRLPVQWVNHPHGDFRGFSGTVVAGRIRRGDPVVVAPSGRTSTITDIVTYEGSQEEASVGQAVTVTLKHQIDISRGNVLATPAHPPEIGDQFAAHVLWMSEHELLPGRYYVMKVGALTCGATITELKYKLNINTLDHQSGKTLEMNEIAHCNLSTDRPIPFDAYDDNRDMGGFILIDRHTNQTVAAGMIEFPLRRASNITWQELDIDKAKRAALKKQKPAVLWFTGLSGSGKSTVANLVEKKLHAMGHHTYILDGDNVRHGLNRDLGFTDADRVENIRRVGEVARLFVDSGTIVLVSFISPFRDERQMVRGILEDGEFLEVFMDTPLEICEQRDPKGLYKKARAGQIANFTGIDSEYEPPESPEIHLAGGREPAEVLAEQVIAELLRRGIA
jgi:bifunctional enzyme CysN/CysC